jgi:two-component system, LytTR family, sensor kinase
MKWKLPQYSSKDYLVLLAIIVPFTVIMNASIFGAKYFQHIGMFLLSTLVTGIAFCIDFVICGAVAVFFKKRFPDEKEVGKKLIIMISVFLLITGIFLTALFKGYEWVDFYGYRFNEKGFVWSYVALGIVNVFLSILFEGIARFDNWQKNMKENELLQGSYRQSQLQGLRSQVNPHFLFNSLNSLSSLISEDEQEAEKFLDEMSKVYRYMLRNDDDQLVTVATELKFLESYLYLLKARYGNGLQLNIRVDETDRDKLLPPLTLQVLVENAFTQNAISKSAPLKINIYSDGGVAIIVDNNVQPKIVSETIDHESGLDNIIKKYRLINQSEVLVEETAVQRTIRIPLIVHQKEALI